MTTEPHAPRDDPADIEFKGGTGNITGQCNCGDFMEVYKRDITFRLKTPETIDPHRVNPKAPFVVTSKDNVGTSHPAVARVLLQGRNIINAIAFERAIDKDAIVQQLHSCKEALIVCDRVTSSVSAEVDRILEEVEAHGLPRAQDRRILNPLPQVVHLEEDSAQFLIHAKRAILAICTLPRMFGVIEHEDTNFEYLGKHLSERLGESAPLSAFVHDYADRIKFLIDLRNYQEHPGDVKTIVDNFSIMPNGKLRPPVWHLSDKAPSLLHNDMVRSTEMLSEIAETIVILLAMEGKVKTFPFIVVRVPDEQVDPHIPIRFHVSADMRRLEQQGSGEQVAVGD